MSTQAITAFVGNGSMSRAFSDTATDGQFQNNILTDDVASTNLGLVMPNATIDNCQVTYTAGSCLWRIQSSQTLLVKRYGFGVKAAQGCYATARIPAYRIAPDDILTVYPLAENNTANTGSTLGWIETSRGFEAFGAQAMASGTATEIKTLVSEQTIGDYAFNATMTGITLQAEDGNHIAKVEVVDQVGGVIWSGIGGPRMPAQPAKSSEYNFQASGLNIPILKGYALKVTVTAD